MIANVGDLPIVLVIAIVVLIGGSQLPKIARNIGLAGKEFRSAQTEAEEEHARKQAAAPPSSLPTASTPAPPAAPGPEAAPAAAAPVEAEPGITLSPAQLDALLKAREDQVRNEAAGNNN